MTRRRAAHAVAVLLLLGAGLPVAPAASAGTAPGAGTGPVAGVTAEGLPERLFVPSPWTPLATEWPIQRAAVLFPGTVAHGRWNRSTGDGLFVLSPSGDQYRRLPWTGDGRDPVSALSADGRWVAWAGDRTDGGDPRLHLLRLGARRVHDVRMPVEADRGVIRQVLFGADRRTALVRGDRRSAAGATVPVVWNVNLADFSAEQVCVCPARFAVDPGGRVWLRDPAPETAALGLPGFRTWPARPPVLPAVAASTGLPDLVSADGRSWAESWGAGSVRVGTTGPLGGAARVLPVPLPRPRVYSWTASRALVGSGTDRPGAGAPAAGQDRFRLSWLDLRTGRVSPVSTAQWAPGGHGPRLAVELAGTGRTVPGARTAVSWTRGDRAEYWLGGLLPAAVTVLLCLLLAFGSSLRPEARARAG